MSQKKKKTICLLHFNDVYTPFPHVCEDTDRKDRLQKYVYGAPAFGYALDQSTEKLKKKYNVTRVPRIFSGDLLGPSLLSSVTKGIHMMEILDVLKTDIGVPGNHEFDYGTDWWQDLITQKTLWNQTKPSSFPWVVANLVETAHPSKIICGMKPYTIETFDGVRVAFLGLVEDWLTECGVPATQVTCLDIIETGRTYAMRLKREEAVQVVIAVTHARRVIDLELAKSVPEIDLVLGGHDHWYFKNVEQRVVKSGSDFEDYSEVVLTIDTDNKVEILEITQKPMVTEEAVSDTFEPSPEQMPPQDPELLKLNQEYQEFFEEKKKTEIGCLPQQPLDASKDALRLDESSFGNFICDVFREHTGAEICIISGGIISSDKVWPVKPLTYEHLFAWFPWGGCCPVVKVNGKAIWDALENGFHLFPRREGRFPQVSGIRVVWDPKREPFHRVLSVEFQGKPLDLEKLYTVTVTEFLINGSDGYESLIGTSENTITSVEMATTKVNILLDYFKNHPTISLQKDGRLKKV